MIARTKALFAGRDGAPLLQPYHDLAKLLRKGAVVSAATTWVFVAGPAALFVCALLASLLVPLAPGPAPIAFAGDAVVFVYLLALGRFLLAAAALDTGSAFEGMGAAREVSFASLAEPGLFFGLLATAKLAGSLSLSAMLRFPLSSHWATAGAALALVAGSWFVLLLAENCRVPFDDPNTHLELTMIHEVMVLDHSGPALGLVLYASAIKLFVFASLIVRLILPAFPGAPYLHFLGLVAGLVLVAVLVGIVESSMARLGLARVPQLLVTACLLSGFGLLLLARG